MITNEIEPAKDPFLNPVEMANVDKLVVPDKVRTNVGIR